MVVEGVQMSTGLFVIPVLKVDTSFFVALYSFVAYVDLETFMWRNRKGHAASQWSLPRILVLVEGNLMSSED